MVEILYSALHITPIPLRGKLTIRMDLSNPEYLTKWPTSLPEIPARACSFQQNDQYTLSVIGPNELLLHTSLENIAPIYHQLYAIYKNMFFQAVDVSDYYHEIRITGNQWKNLLEKSIPFDFRDKNFENYTIAGVVFESTQVFLLKFPDEIIMQYRKSFEKYVFHHLETNALEFEKLS